MKEVAACVHDYCGAETWVRIVGTGVGSDGERGGDVTMVFQPANDGTAEGMSSYRFPLSLGYHVLKRASQSDCTAVVV